MSEETELSEKSETTINAEYHFNSRLKGETKLKLFNEFYLQVSQCHLKQRREFRIEVATLNPEAVKHEERAYAWMVVSLISALGCLYSIYALFTIDNTLMALLGTATTAAITALLVTLYQYSSVFEWRLETRNALYPLITIPYHRSQRKEAQAFVDTLQQAINKNVESKRYNSEDLFAGELRMLRRLAKHKILSDTLYGQAKAYMMKNHGHPAA